MMGNVSGLGKTGDDRQKQIGAEISEKHPEQHAGAENRRNKFERNHLESPLVSEETRRGLFCRRFVAFGK